MTTTTTISLSRVAKKPVIIPAGVDISVEGQELSIKGPKGKMLLPIHPFVSIEIADKVLQVKSNPAGGYSRSGSGANLRKSIAGTTRANIANSVHGVKEGFEKKLVLVGVGYRAQAKGNVLGLTLGFSHPVEVAIPEGITVETPTQTEIIVKGFDKNLVGKVAAEIRYYREPEPYKGKGIRYANEQIVRKETKKK